MAIANIETLECPAQQVIEQGRKTLERIVHNARKRDLAPLQASANEATFLIEAARIAVESLGLAVDGTEKRISESWQLNSLPNCRLRRRISLLENY